ncbi:MAG: hypothetical protein V3V02_01970 [Rhizobiaceae bacterium]
MKAGLTSSVAVHVAALAWGMVSLASPTPLSVPDVEALPIDIIPIEAITKTIKGAKKADPAKKPAPKKTKLPPKIKQAVNVGDTNNDTKAKAPKVEKAPPVEKTEVPTPVERPAPAKKPTPVPTPKLAPKPKPKTDIAMLLKKSETLEPEKPAEEAFKKLPQKVSTPKQRPTKPKPEAAETTTRKEVKKVTSAKSKNTKKKTDATKKAVVNKTKSSSGGAKRSTKKAALGAKKANNSTKLAQSEIDALRGRLEGCWSVGDLTGHPDADKMRARVTFKLTRSGEIDGRVKVKVSGTDRGTKSTLAVRVRAAVTECAPYELPQDKYETWSDVVVNFSLRDML